MRNAFCILEPGHDGAHVYDHTVCGHPAAETAEITDAVVREINRRRQLAPAHSYGVGCEARER